MQRAAALSNNSTMMLAALGAAFAAGGREQEANAVLTELQDSGRRKYVTQVFVAAIHAGLGEMDPAIACLNRAYEDKCPWLLRCLVRDARFDPLRRDARFNDLTCRCAV